MTLDLGRARACWRRAVHRARRGDRRDLRLGPSNYVRLDPRRAVAHVVGGEADAAPSRPTAASRPSRRADRPPSRTGTSARSSTRCWSGRSTTPTATAPATCAGWSTKLDYLQWLGVDCLWLPPFYDSPLRDGGYDIRDFRAVLPEFGTVEDFVHLLDEAHQRGIRVITDLVLNHTSDAHPWFQESRRDPDGPYGDFYVWSDDDRAVRRRADHLRRHRDVELDLRPGARPVLLAPVLQPPARPELRQPGRAGGDARRPAVLAGPRHRRLPAGRRALPVRARRAPTARTCRRRTSSSSCCRKVVDDEYPGRVLLAEANQWPADVVRLLRRPERRRRRVPHGVPLPADAAHLHGRAAGVAGARSRRSWRRRRRSRPAASGASSCATTTS